MRSDINTWIDISIMLLIRIYILMANFQILANDHFLLFEFEFEAIMFFFFGYYLHIKTQVNRNFSTSTFLFWGI
jgi:hypothetical protein